MAGLSYPQAPAGLSFLHPASQALHELTASIPLRIEALLCHLRDTVDARAR